MWKPGQLVTIDGHIYRILKRIKYSKNIIRNRKLTTIYELEPCREVCVFKYSSRICGKYCIPSAYHRYIPHDCYFKLVK